MLGGVMSEKIKTIARDRWKKAGNMVKTENFIMQIINDMRKEDNDGGEGKENGEQQTLNPDQQSFLWTPFGQGEGLARTA